MSLDDLSSLGRHACTEAVRWRLAELESETEGEKLHRRRMSLDLLHFTLENEGQLDWLQLRRLRELLGDRATFLHGQPLPFWPGGQYAFLVGVANELTGGEEAVELIDRLLAVESA